MLSSEQIGFFAERGYLAPLDAIDSMEAVAVRAHIERHVADNGGIPNGLAGLRTKAHLRCPALMALVRRPAILDAVACLIGPDLLCRSASVFLKEPGDPAYVAWHQDAAYWNLEPDDVITAWISISESTLANGALEVIPGSHRDEILPHGPSNDPANQLQHGQKILATLDPGRVVRLVLKTGAMSLHHVRIAHGSQPNRSTERRIGFAIRYVAAHVRKLGPRRDSAILVRGTDRFGHFDPEPGSAND
jgi:ectoine hydroxylase-related dioxygenase (phytanoyl-CoA dioxygenase family)